MKASLRPIALWFLVLTAIVWGCRSMYEGDDAVNDNAAVVLSDVGADTSAPGYFVEGSHDIEGGGPPPTTAEEDEVGEETQSHFRAIQLDPGFEDTAGPKFLKYADMDGDGLVDLVSGHTQSQPVQLHLQRREADSIRFLAVNLGGTVPIGTIAGVDIADIDGDGALDVVVLVKHTGALAFCLTGQMDRDLFTGVLVILFAPGPGGDITDGDSWQEVVILDSHSAINERWGRAPDFARPIEWPEDGGYTSLAVGDIDGANGPDIVVTSNVPEPDCGTGHNTVEVWYNPGAASRDGSSQDITTVGPPPLASPPSFWYPTWIDIDAPYVRDCEVVDVDGDGDLDVVSAYSNSVTRNVRWYRNPLNESGAASLIDGIFMNDNRALLATAWEQRPIGTVDGDIGALNIGDMDNDGFPDILCRTQDRGAALWFRRPTTNPARDDGPIFPPENPVTGSDDNAPVPERFDFPWQVYALDDYAPYRPSGIAIGDLTGDGVNDAAVAVGGALYWYDYTKSVTGDIYDEWGRDFVLDDTKDNGATDDPTDFDFVDNGTLLNNLVIVDVDADGLNDIVATFDRRVDSGLAADSIVWFRNTLRDENDE